MFQSYAKVKGSAGCAALASPIIHAPSFRIQYLLPCRLWCHRVAAVPAAGLQQAGAAVPAFPAPKHLLLVTDAPVRMTWALPSRGCRPAECLHCTKRFPATSQHLHLVRLDELAAELGFSSIFLPSLNNNFRFPPGLNEFVPLALGRICWLQTCRLQTCFCTHAV